MVYTQNSAYTTRTTARSGFTLIELLIAIAIVGIIAGVTVPLFMNMLKGARIKTTKQSLKMTQSALGLFKIDLGVLPLQLNDLVRRPSVSDHYDQEQVSEWAEGGYLKKVPKDAWKKKFHYRLTPEGEHPYELYSYGRKGKKGVKKSEWIRAW